MKIRLFAAAFILIFFYESWGAAESSATSPISFDKGIEFHDPENRYSTTLRFRAQNLFAYQTQGRGDFDAAQITAQVRRLRLRLGGWMLDPRVSYNLQLSFSRGDQDWSDTGFPNVIRDATLLYRLTPELQVSFGQTKLPGNRQRVISSGELQFPDRSIVNRVFNLDRDFSGQLLWQPIASSPESFTWNFRTALGSGRGRNSGPTPWSFIWVGRLEALPWGEFTDRGDYFEGDLAHETTPKLSVAMGAATNRNARRAGGQIGASLAESKDFRTLFADTVLKYRGFSLSAEYLARQVSGSPTDSAGAFVLEGEGLNIQSGYFISKAWELAARASLVRPDDVLVGVAENQTQYTLGATRYLRGHRLKVQSDLTLNQENSTESWIARFQVELGI